MTDVDKSLYILGIDTGGTYTDSVIINEPGGEIICKSKAMTTRDDLQEGISNSIAGLNFDKKDQIAMVSLSTTLATNAIVEKKGCSVGLILVGGKTFDALPVEKCWHVNGKMDIIGNEIESIRPDEIRKAAEDLKESVDAVAISGYASVRNPKHEIQIKKIIEEITDMPIFCAHELTGSLGYYERTITAALNAGLITIIKDFLKSTKIALKNNNINAPVMIVKGDGSLMQESLLLEKPIETILSGPASSIIGAGYLTKEKDAFIFDMGGTTSDIANISNGVVKTRDEGAKIGGWLTRVNAAYVSTFGLGGDSKISIDNNRKITVGPERVQPICVSARRDKKVSSKLDQMRLSEEENVPVLYRKIMVIKTIAVNNNEQSILDKLDRSPLSRKEIVDAIGEDFNEKDLISLIDKGMIIKTSITPTDLLHFTGQYEDWDVNAAVKAIRMASEKLSISPKKLVENAVEEITKLLCLFCLQSSADFENKEFDFFNEPSAMYLLEKAFKNDDDEFLCAAFKLDKPIIGVGAPAYQWLPIVAKKLDTTLIIPKHAEVANAIGAALGGITESAIAVIRPDKEKNQYILYMPKKRMVFTSKEQAEDYAVEHLAKYVRRIAVKAGGTFVEVSTSKDHVFTHDFNKKEESFVETIIKAIAVSKPSF